LIPTFDRLLDDGWNKACALHEHLAVGGTLPPKTPGPAGLNPGEVAFGEVVMLGDRFYATKDDYEAIDFGFQNSALALAGLSANLYGISKSAANAAPQWRDTADVRTVLTNRRFICAYESSRL
jgi:hypothetical protein